MFIVKVDPAGNTEYNACEEEYIIGLKLTVQPQEDQKKDQ
jgi:hypothetical protein